LALLYETVIYNLFINTCLSIHLYI